MENLPRHQPQPDSEKRIIIFDLFGTLLRFNQRAFFRELRSALECSSAGLDREILRKLMVECHSSEEDALQRLCEAMGVKSPEVQHIQTCRAALDKHLASIEVWPGAPTLLGFLKRRGFKLCLLSNTAQVFKSALYSCGLAGFFDVVSFSCDTGKSKPDQEAYLTICRTLSIDPAQCVFIGDSIENDFCAPSALGMQALCLRSTVGAESFRAVELSDLAWTNLGSIGNTLQWLITSGASFQFGDTTFEISGVTTLPDAAQGRYNIVGRVRAAAASGQQERDFCIKRYLNPESVYLEEMAYAIMGMIFPHGIRAALLPSSEVLLVMSMIEAKHWATHDMNIDTAEIIGFHCAVAYLIGNADLRPRNTFIDRTNGTMSVSIIDLEHCFFDRALEVNDLVGRFTPTAIDELGDEVHSRTKHRVLSPAATRRARKSFLAIEDRSHELVLRFKKGWIAAFESAKALRVQIETALMNRIYREPYLIIGTQSYRRAMASVDVKDIVSRIEQDPVASFDQHY